MCDIFTNFTVIVMFHNLQGYDSMFILQELYNQHRLVENQVCVGIKVRHDWP